MGKAVKYIETGIMTCPLLPENWAIKKLKYLAKVQTGRTPSIQGAKVDFFENGEINWFTPADFGNERYLDNSSRKVTQLALDNGEIQLFPNHSIYLVSIGATLGKIGISEKSGTANQQINVISFNEDINPVFGFYFLKSISSNLINEVDFTTLPILNQTKTKDIFIPFPSIETQEIIANFLDQKTAEIDNLISKKQKLIECLKEERMAIINQAVTKGINPNAEMKESGIDWLGQIPKHWEVKKLKYVLAEAKGALKPGPFGSDLKNSDLTPNGEYKVYTQRNVIDNDFEIGEDYISEDKFQLLNVFEVNENDILISTRGTIGKSVIVPKEFQKGIIHPCLIRVTLNQEIIFNKFLQLFFNESSYFLENVKLYSNSTIIEVIYGNTLREVFVPVPPKDEQVQITNEVEHKMKKIDDTIGKIEQEIVLINEYRTSLVNEVVTGKKKLV